MENIECNFFDTDLNMEELETLILNSDLDFLEWCASDEQDESSTQVKMETNNVNTQVS